MKVAKTVPLTKPPRPSHRVARWWAIGAGVVCAAAGYVGAGASGMFGAAIGAALVVAFLSTGLIPVLIARDAQLTAGIGMALLLLTYTLRLALALAALVLLSRTDVADPQWLGATVVVTALTWLAIHVAHAVRRSKREPTVAP